MNRRSYASLGAEVDDTACQARRRLAQTWFRFSNWAPVGDTYYTADLVTMTSRTVQSLLQTLARITLALGPNWTYAPLITARDQVQASIATSTTITNAIAAANRQGATVMTIPGYKAWAETALNRCASAVGEIDYLECMQRQAFPGIVIDTIMGAAAAVGTAARKVAVVVGLVVYKVARLPLDLLDATSKIIRYAPWAILGLATLYVVRSTKRPNPGRRRRR